MITELTEEQRERLKHFYPKLVPVGVKDENGFLYLQPTEDDKSVMIFKIRSRTRSFNNSTLPSLVNSINHLIVWTASQGSDKLKLLMSQIRVIYDALGDDLDLHVLERMKDMGADSIDRVRKEYITAMCRTLFSLTKDRDDFNTLIVRYVKDNLHFTKDASEQEKVMMTIIHVVSLYSKIIGMISPSSKFATLGLINDIVRITENTILDDNPEVYIEGTFSGNLDEVYLANIIKPEFNICATIRQDLVSEIIAAMYRLKLVDKNNIPTSDFVADVIVTDTNIDFLKDYIYSAYKDNIYLHCTAKAVVRNELCRVPTGV